MSTPTGHGADDTRDTSDAGDRRTPRTVAWAGALTAVEGVLAIVAAVILVIREMAGHHEDAVSGYGTAAWFAIIGAGVLVGGIALLRGRRWGRAIAIVAQILLLPIAYALLTDSHQPWFGVPLGLCALVILGLILAPSSTRWLVGDLDPDDSGDHAGR